MCHWATIYINRTINRNALWNEPLVLHVYSTWRASEELNVSHVVTEQEAGRRLGDRNPVVAFVVPLAFDVAISNYREIEQSFN